VTAVAADPSVPGGLMSGANRWVAHFAPLGSGGGISIVEPEGTIGFVPVGAAAVSPQVDPSHDNEVMYSNVWPGVSLKYTVLGAEVEEQILLTGPTVQTVFPFMTSGPGLRLTRRSRAGSRCWVPCRGWCRSRHRWC
jgi:hypothetical protein